MANIPSVSSPLPRDLQQFIQRVREALDGGGADAVVTARQLIAAGVVKTTSGGGFAPVNGPIEAPRPPRNLTTSGALANIIVAWAAPNYSGHAYTEVWAHTSDVIGDAVLVGMTAGNSFAHNLGAAATRYYWARNVNQNGVVSAYNATNGTEGTTGQDAAYLLSVLSGKVTSTQLATSLGTRIDLVDADASVTGSVNQRVQTVATVVGDNTAAVAVNTNSVGGLEAQYTVKIDNNGHVSGFGLASTTVDGARVSDFIVAADRFSVVNPTETFDIGVSFSGSSIYRRYIQVSLSIYNAYTYVAGDTLTVREMGVYSREYNITGKGNIISPNLGYVLEIARTSNYPGTLIDFPVQSSSWFTANYPNANVGINLEVKSPFVISTGSTQINGVAVPAGTYIDSAMIADATINNAQINNLTADKITASLLNTVDFYGNTIAGSTIYLGGTITYTTDSGGNNIGIASVASPKVVMAPTGAFFAVDAFTIDNPGGTNAVPFSITSGVVSIDSALIKDGTITNAMIGNTIQSTNYSDANNTGWKLEKNGNLDLNSASITAGTLQSTDGNFVIDLTNGTITISA